MVANLKEKTGKTLDAWLKVVSKSKLAKHREIVNLLKSEHAVTHGYANLIAAKFLEAGQPAASDHLPTRDLRRGPRSTRLLRESAGGQPRGMAVHRQPRLSRCRHLNRFGRPPHRNAPAQRL